MPLGGEHHKNPPPVRVRLVYNEFTIFSSIDHIVQIDSMFITIKLFAVRCGSCPIFIRFRFGSAESVLKKVDPDLDTDPTQICLFNFELKIFKLSYLV